jgi:hypothetical protein
VCARVGAWIFFFCLRKGPHRQRLSSQRGWSRAWRTLRCNCVSIRQHTSAYVSIRQHTSAYVSIRQHASAYVRIPALRLLSLTTSAYVSIPQHTSAYASIRQHTCVGIAELDHIRYLLIHRVLRLHTSAYVSIRQHTPAHVGYLLIHRVLRLVSTRLTAAPMLYCYFNAALLL